MSQFRTKFDNYSTQACLVFHLYLHDFLDLFTHASWLRKVMAVLLKYNTCVMPVILISLLYVAHPARVCITFLIVRSPCYLTMC